MRPCEEAHLADEATLHLMSHEIKAGDYFKWQGAYGAFTLRYDDVPIVKQYIVNQKRLAPPAS